MTAAEQITADDLCLNVADGHKLDFVVASLTKRTLKIPGIKSADRLDLLERLNGMTDDWFTADMLAGIDPMDDTGLAIYEQACTLDSPDDKTHAASFKVLTTPAVFRHFVQLNPSIMAAIKLRADGRQDRHPAPRSAETPPPRLPGAIGAAEFAHMQRRANGVTQHRSHYPTDKINRMGGGLPDFAYDDEGDQRGN
jgi:hypothetical protein